MLVVVGCYCFVQCDFIFVCWLLLVVIGLFSVILYLFVGCCWLFLFLLFFLFVQCDFIFVCWLLLVFFVVVGFFFNFWCTKQLVDYGIVMMPIPI